MIKIGKLLDKDPGFLQVKNGLAAGKTPMNISGLSPVHKAHLIAQLVDDQKKTALVVVQDEGQATRLCLDINTMAGREMARPFGSREYVFREMEGISREYEHARISALTALLGGECQVLVASAEGATQFTIPKKNLQSRTLVLHSGDTIPQQELISRLILAGYVRYEQVTGVSEFAVRGGLVDIFPPSGQTPVRLEFWGDDIDSINTFDLGTQRRQDYVETLVLPPVSELSAADQPELLAMVEKAIQGLDEKKQALVKPHFARDLERLAGGEMLTTLDRYLPLLFENPVTVADYFDGNSLLFYSEMANSKEILQNHESLHNEEIKALFAEGLLFKGLDNFYGGFDSLLANAQKMPTLYLDTFARTVEGVRLNALAEVAALSLSPWGGELSVLEEDLHTYRDQGYKILVFAGTQKAAENITKELTAAGLPAVFGEDAGRIKAKETLILAGSLSAGMAYPNSKVVVFSHLKILAADKRKKKKTKGNIRNLSDLTVGDYVVHTTHGIGVFSGIHQIETEGLTKDYIKIQYAGADVLYVPVTQLDLVSKYIGPRESGSLRLSKLNSGQWEKTRSRVKAAVGDMAKELIALYSKRLNAKGYAFPPDTEWQKDFEDRFEFQETNDQLNAIADVKRDMERPVPMDRLLCGDVGFGKTEIALRAAFKCVTDGKQCAILVPTTILAWQHYKTLVKRFDGYPVNIALLSRFRTPKQREETVKKLRTGEVDLVVGTHRLVQKDVVFKRIGLAIIDEEQRFGVKHKEQIKELATNVDVLTLSATPIPRTMNMALSGIRDMSTLEEPPQDRQPVQTFVMEHNDGILAEAIRRELKRDGQVYYLHNKVEDMERTVLRLQAMLPDAAIGYAHGQMNEEELSEVWRKLLQHEIDVLVCTTIIETGVDVSNCNTLIIENADNLGLAQLYQIRGRVGRSSRRAYAYFTFRRGKVVTELATKRLTAIKEFTNFGSGFQIAMRDLEIRGAGNILGATQHGHMESVGYDLYLKLLSEAIAEEKGEARPEANVECLVDVQMEAFIPKNYILGLTQRLDIYRRIAGITNVEDARDVIDELVDRFGEPPKAVTGLIDVALLRNTAASMGIVEISQTNSRSLVFYMEQLNPDLFGRLAGMMAGRVTISTGKRPSITVLILKDKTVLATIEEVLSLLGGIRKWLKEQNETTKQEGEKNE